MPRLVAASVKGPRKFIVLAVLIGAGVLLYIARRAEAYAYNGPFYASSSTSPWSPNLSAADPRLYGLGPSGAAAPTTAVADPCIEYMDTGATSASVDLPTGALVVDFSLWNSRTRNGNDSMSVRSRSDLSGSTQVGCFTLIPSFETTAQSLNGGATVVVRHANGRIGTWTNAGAGFVGPTGTQSTLTTVGGLLRLTDKFGNRIDFDVRGMPATATDTDGNVTTYSYNADYETTSIVNDRGKTTTLTHNASRAITSINDPDGRTWTLGYDGNGALNRITTPATQDQPNGTNIVIAYGGGKITGFGGNRVGVPPGGGGGGGGGGGTPDAAPYQTFTYDAQGRVATATIDSCTTTFSYAAGITTVTDPLGNVRRYYHSGGKITKTDMLVAGAAKYVTRFGYAGEYISSIVYPRLSRVDFSWDARGNLTQRRHRETDTSTNAPSDLVHAWTYNASNFMTGYTDPRGNAWTYARDAAGRLTQITHPTVSNPSSQTASRSYVYNGVGQVTRVTDEEGNVTDFSYFTSGSSIDLLEKVIVDPTGMALTTTLTYDVAGTVATVSDPRGNFRSATWDAMRRILQTDAPSALGYTVKYAYDARGMPRLREVENLDKDGVLSTTHPWIKTRYSWSEKFDLTEIEEDLSPSTTRRTQLNYDCNGNLTLLTKPEGNLETWAYDERDRVATHVTGTGATGASTTVYEYDEHDNRTTVTDGRGNATTRAYDLFDRRVTATNALGHYAAFEYDKNGNLTKAQRKDSGGAELQRGSYLYDTRNRRWKRSALFREGGTTHPDAVTTWERLKTGQVFKVTTPSGAVTTRTRDAALRLTMVTDDIGNEASYTLDANGNRTAISFLEIDGASSVTHSFERSYDTINRVTEAVEIDRTDSNNRLVTKLSWDSRSNLVFRVNAENNPTRFTFDPLSRLIKRERALATGATLNDITQAQVTEWGFDKNNRIVSHKDDGANESTWTYDALDRRTTMTFPDAKSVLYEYDLAHNTTKVTDPAGNVIVDVFDVLNRNTARTVTRATGFLGTTTETRTFDPLNRIATNADDDYHLTHGYAEIGFRSLIASETQTYTGATGYPLTVTKGYDSRGNVIAEGYPAGANLSLTLSYNAISQLTSITDGTNSIASYAHVGLRRKSISFGNGATQTNSFTGFRNEIASMDHKTSASASIVRMDYGYNKVHDRTYERFGASGSAGDAFEYDKIRRLTKAYMGSSTPSSPSGNNYAQKIDYNYDDDGNRSSVVTTPYQQTATTVNYTTNTLNQYTAVGGATRTHDSNGNLIDDGTYKYAYDYKNQIVEIRKKSDSSLVAEYKYDPLGRRVEKDVTGSGKERYVLCTVDSGNDLGNLGNVMATYDGAGNWKQSFVHNGDVDDIVMLEQSDVLDFDNDANTTERTRSYFHQNALGSVMEITDANEATVASYRYTPYGQVTITRNGQTQTSDPLGQHWGYTGRFQDAESGLWYYRARYYDSSRGRFLQRDPLGYAAGPQLYGYVDCNPINSGDPRGLAPGGDSHRSPVFAGAWISDDATGHRDARHAESIRQLDEKLKEQQRKAKEAQRRAHEAYLAYLKALGRAWGALGDLEFARECTEDVLIAVAIIKAIQGAYSALAGAGGSGSDEPDDGNDEGGGGPDRSECFVPGTVVQADDGEVSIEDVEAGSYVWSGDPKSGDWALRKVLATMRHEYSGVVVEVGVSGSRFVATANHPVWVRRGELLASRPPAEDLPVRDRSVTIQGRWVAAGDLRVGDVLVALDGERAIESIHVRKYQGHVYNVQVSGHETYSVGRAGVLVHNKPRPRGAGPGDTARVDQLARKHGVEEEDLEALHDAIKDEKDATDGGTISDETLEEIVKEFAPKPD